MKWSWRVARIAGIDLYVHATFVLLLAWIGYREYANGPRAIVAALTYIVALFTIVVLHELGHALTARRFGVQTRDIILLPIGGVARLERMPRNPRQELLVALAGPAVNVALAIVLFAVVRLGGPPPAAYLLYDLDMIASVRAFLYQLVFVNVVLALFNLLPAFPMDGGRVLRALLAMRMSSYARATSIAARVGRVMALCLAVAGLYGFRNPFWALIAVFVWIGAGNEAAAVQTTSSLDGVPIEDLMIRDVHTLTPNEPLSRAVQLTLDGFQQDFPVLDEQGLLVGVLTRADLLRALSERGTQATVADAMHRRFETAGPDERAEEAIDRLRACGCNAMPVVRGRELLGVLTLENIGEYIMIRSALGSSRG
jgi:Zn-dependent protease/predicted transcriptional regulator